MQAIGQLVSTDIRVIKTQLIPTDKHYDNDRLFDMLPDLVNPQFKAWYCKMFFSLGKDEVLKRASIARADAKTDKRRYFSYLLKSGQN